MTYRERHASQDDQKADHKVECGSAKGDEVDQIEQHVDYSGAALDISPEEARLVKKLDWRIMPCLWSMYFLYVARFTRCPTTELTQSRNYLDRNAITQAKLDDLEDDLGLVGNQYNTCISILFVG
jgi:hypothetical protein